ncbi:hypothetical protein ABEB36_004925 [Hypothenemus hampei]|uniref:Uncharacterized protein n=1 Tax=Hypothenemus hampei TaxID=57062 RepID=A0ABD1EWW9_HYPHA
MATQHDHNSSKIPKSLNAKSRSGSLDWDSDSAKTGTVKRRPTSSEFPHGDNGFFYLEKEQKNRKEKSEKESFMLNTVELRASNKVSDSDSGINSPLSPGSVYGVFVPKSATSPSSTIGNESCCRNCIKEKNEVNIE